MDQLEFCLDERVSTDCRELMWQTFFVERGRGCSFESHFPWMQAKRTDIICCSLRHEARPVAALVARLLPMEHAAGSQSVCAVIGLVCVASELRGQGLGHELLSRSVDALDQRGVEAMTLWTRSPAVYVAHGFAVADQSLYGVVAMAPHLPEPIGTNRTEVYARTWPDEQERGNKNRGLPAYAHHAIRFSSAYSGATIIATFDADGVAVAEWDGKDEDVVSLLPHCLPNRWRLNAMLGDSLLTALGAKGAKLDLQNPNLQMWRMSGQALTANSTPIRILDRI